jgi:hypothetical protein
LDKEERSEKDSGGPSTAASQSHLRTENLFFRNTLLHKTLFASNITWKSAKTERGVCGGEHRMILGCKNGWDTHFVMVLSIVCTA